MEKELKDYLHLYGIGCPISTIDGEGMVLTIHAKGVTVSLRQISSCQELHGFDKGNGGLHRTYLFKDNFCKLILHSLFDIKDEEAIVISETTFTDVVSKEDKAKIGKAFIDYNFCNRPMPQTAQMHNDLNEFDYSVMPEIVRFLLLKKFDLFGLIESGLAIDKATLNQLA